MTLHHWNRGQRTNTQWTTVKPHHCNYCPCILEGPMVLQVSKTGQGYHIWCRWIDDAQLLLKALIL